MPEGLHNTLVLARQRAVAGLVPRQYDLLAAAIGAYQVSPLTILPCLNAFDRDALADHGLWAG